ncbi:IucA/IucC family protein [Saccharospirillum alexandrii]|uniref:IucA/IucC family protein n=1 Tax=Saccharospirillum alexandrii TaxID=2448477 RepID=UPI00373591F0
MTLLNPIENLTEPTVNQIDTVAWVAALRSPHLANVEQRVLRQLIQALVFEEVLDYEDHTRHSDSRLVVLTGTDATGQKVRYLAEGEFKESYGLLRLSRRPVMRVENGGTPYEASLTDFAADVLAALPDTTRLNAFMNELTHTLVKDVQAQATALPGTLPADQRYYDALEGHLMDAHSYHPCYKSRLGFSFAENQRYGPEFQQRLPLYWVALHKNKAQLNASESLDSDQFLRSVLGDHDLSRFETQLNALGKNRDDYRLIPVHPWQWNERIATEFYPELATGDLIWLGQGQDAWRAQQSIRTLANADYPEKPYAKVSLGITNTSTSRIMAAHTCLNGPVITDWLQRLIGQDPIARDMDFVILREVLGVTCDYERLPAARRLSAYGHLGVVWRESLHTYLRPGEDAIPFNGLSHRQGNGEPLIERWIEHHGLEAWTQQLLTVAVGPIIHMLFGHGIGMESHGQNIILIHEDGWPKRIALKDFHDGVRYSRDHLTHPDQCPELFPVPPTHAQINPNSYILTNDLNNVRDYSLDAFFFIALSDVCLFLNDCYQLPEKTFWQMTAEVIHDYQAAHPEHRERFECFDVFTGCFEIEELTKRRLFGDAQPRIKTVRNPLAAYRRRQRNESLQA